MEEDKAAHSSDDGGKKETSPRHAKSKKNSKIDKKLEKLKSKYENRGIVYISRLPPHMKPQKLRHILEKYATIGRIYLAPEDPSLRKKRKKQGKDTGKNFTEGWVEFEQKSEAKQIAAMLNGQQIGGRRRDAHYYDLWNMKYLPKFKWDHLTEEINYQKAVREQRMANEISAAKRERDFYLSRVDKAKAVEAILERKKEKNNTDKGGDDQDVVLTKKRKKDHNNNTRDKNDDNNESGSGGVRVLRTYNQRKSKPDPVGDEAPMLSEGVLKLIAGRK